MISIRLVVAIALLAMNAPLACAEFTQSDTSEASSMHLTEVYYNSIVANEYVVVSNSGDDALDLSNWTLSDLEGTLAFPPCTFALAGQRIVVAQNSSLYSRDTLDTADLQFAGGNASGMIHDGGVFAMNNEGDEVLLADAEGDIIDVFVYGTSRYSGLGWKGAPAIALHKGQVASRGVTGGVFLDTDTSADWNGPRSRVIGQSSHDLRRFEFDGMAQVILSPDSSSHALSSIVELASRSIYLNAYEFTNQALGDALASALKRGVDVRVLAEGQPVGGIRESELSILRSLKDLGAGVRVMLDNSSLGVKARYRYDHAKYIVLDNETLLVSSENWGPTGFPPHGKSGNRGWSVRLDNAGLSSFMADVFLDDWNPGRMDSVDIHDSRITGVPSEGVTEAGFHPTFLPDPFSGHFLVTPVIGPDVTLEQDAIIGLIKSAKSTILLEQFYVARSWDSYPNSYLEEVVNAARRGVEVRVLLDSSWYNTDENESSDNDDTVAYLNGIAENEGIPINAKLANSASHDLLKIHNKGLVVDGERALVSSINWNLNSVTANREVGLIVENRDFASILSDAFEFDWRDDVTAPFAEAGRDFSVVEGTEAYLSATSSRDDMGIDHYLWDIDSDGRFELEGPLVSWLWSAPGTYLVTLRVEDAWGNSACDWVNVTIIREETAAKVSGVPLEWILAPVAAAASAPIILAIAIRRRK